LVPRQLGSASGSASGSGTASGAGNGAAMAPAKRERAMMTAKKRIESEVCVPEKDDFVLKVVVTLEKAEAIEMNEVDTEGETLFMPSLAAHRELRPTDMTGILH
jgi:hypothetical protein